ncbi:MAG: hypothetical protein HY084_04915 [Gemmatimonadetes bacterium]|nr:hypothetical protein [Gemmatimonadota bacterium]
MKNRRLLAHVAILLLVAMPLAAQNVSAARDSLHAQLAAPALIKGFSPDSSFRRTVAMVGGPELLAARGALVAFLIEAQSRHPNLRPLLTQRLLQRYPGGTGILTAIFAPEMHVHSLSIVGARGISAEMIELDVVFLIFVEGKFDVNETKARLRRVSGRWLLDGFGAV